MAEKQKHLRPEIRLLNELMQIRDDSEREQVSQCPGVGPLILLVQALL